MKQLIIILLALFSFTLIYGQDGEPTKEETLQYIKSVLEGNEFNIISQNTEKGAYIKEEAITIYSDLKLESCKFEFLREYKFLYTSKGFTNSPDLYRERMSGTNSKQILNVSKTESIVFLTAELLNFKDGNEISTGYKMVGLTFRQKKDDGMYDDSVSVYIGLFNSDFQDYKSLKIYKAFQNLRKLCNAPEPISFD